MRQCLGRVLLVVLVALSPSTVGVCADEANPAIDRLRGLGIALKSQPVWVAEYRQEYIPSGMTMGEVVDGTVWIAWPDRALFASGEPRQRFMGLAGLEVRLLDLENGTCDDHHLNVEEWERIPLVAVLEPERALDQFFVEADGADGLSLTPREPGGVERVTIMIGTDGLPLEVVVSDPQGATSTFDFKDWLPVEEPPDGRWLPQAPEGLPCLSDRGD